MTQFARILRNTLSHLTGSPTIGDDRSLEQQHADALITLADAYTKGTLTGGREQPTIIVVIDIDVLQGRTPGAGYTDTGDIIPAEIVRNMCTNANLQRLLTSGSIPLDLGRTQRSATDAQYKAILARDGGCRMPGCNIPAAWCEIDHIQQWDAHHGPTNIDNLLIWCKPHHHYRHRPDVTLHGNANNLTITLPNGQNHQRPTTRHHHQKSRLRICMPLRTGAARHDDGALRLPIVKGRRQRLRSTPPSTVARYRR